MLRVTQLKSEYRPISRLVSCRIPIKEAIWECCFGFLLHSGNFVGANGRNPNVFIVPFYCVGPFYTLPYTNWTVVLDWPDWPDCQSTRNAEEIAVGRCFDGVCCCWLPLLLATAAAAGDFCTNFRPMNDSRKLCVSRLLLVWFGLVGLWWVWVWISWINDYYRYCRHQMCVMCVWDGKKVLLFHIIRW